MRYNNQDRGQNGTAGNSAESSIEQPESASLDSQQVCFERCPGETPRAYSAFMAYFDLGHNRSLQGVVDKLGECLSTVKAWSAKHDWLPRIQGFNSGLLQQRARDRVALDRRHAANWAERLERFREQEWDAAQKLIAAAQCFLESLGDDAVEKMTLSQVSRALRISSSIARCAFSGAELAASSDPVMAPIQRQMLDDVDRLYGLSPQARKPNSDSLARENELAESPPQADSSQPVPPNHE